MYSFFQFWLMEEDRDSGVMEEIMYNMAEYQPSFPRRVLQLYEWTILTGRSDSQRKCLDNTRFLIYLYSWLASVKIYS